MPSPPELAIIAFIVVVIFGVGKLGDVGGALGRGIREFRNEVNTAKDSERRLEDNEREVEV